MFVPLFFWNKWYTFGRPNRHMKPDRQACQCARMPMRVHPHTPDKRAQPTRTTRTEP